MRVSHEKRVRGAARIARQPSKLKVKGSNPFGPALFSLIDISLSNSNFAWSLTEEKYGFIIHKTYSYFFTDLDLLGFRRTILEPKSLIPNLLT